MKIQLPDSFINDSYRDVVWWDSNRLPTVFLKPPGSTVEQVYDGRIYSKPITENDESLVDQPRARLCLYAYSTPYQGMTLGYYQGLIVAQRNGSDSHILGQTEAIFIEERPEQAKLKAAEELYKVAFGMMTEAKCDDATTPETHKDVILVGEWKPIAQVEAMPAALKRGWRLIEQRTQTAVAPKFGDPDVVFQEGFYIGCQGRDKLKCGICGIASPKGWNNGRNTFEWSVKLAGKGITVNQSLDWFIANSQKYLIGECMCKHCNRIVPGKTGVIVRLFGFLCPICIDWFVDYRSEQLTPDLYDREI